MTAVAYTDRFNFGRLFSDAGHVFARAWLPIAIGALVLNVAPVVAASLPWWEGSTYTPSLHRIWAEVTLAKNVVMLAATSLANTFACAVSLGVLSGAGWRSLLGRRRVTAGAVTYLVIGVLVNWPSLVSPFAAVSPSIESALWLLALAQPVGVLLTAPFLGLAVATAIVERASVRAAIARSYGLLRGLRWRMLGAALCYQFLLFVSVYGAVWALYLSRLPYQPAGLGRVAFNLSVLPMAVFFVPVFSSFYLQARRLADGPSAAELHDVFA